MKRAIKALLSGVFLIILSCGCVQKDSRTHLQFSSWGSKSEIEILEPILNEFEKITFKNYTFYLPQTQRRM